uniref:Peroxisomal biogenesis factor 5-like b n=1 Tax=Cyprinus carpio TaxID=7962 RepID=A0A8C2GJH1_CYPCA
MGGVYINVTNKINILWKWVHAKLKKKLVYVLQLCSEQQESRPLLSPSIDDFQSESKSDASTRPVTSNTAVLSTALDLVDLSEPCERRWSWDRWSPRGSRKNGFSKSSLHKKKTEETELIQVETEPSSPSRSNPERASLDSGILLNERHFGTLVTFYMVFQYWLCPEGLLNCLPQSDTEFWDKMQAEWEELARRNWLEDADSEGLVPLNFSPTEKVFSTNQNALHQWFYTMGWAPLAWQVLGTTQAENENEQAAIVCLQRCLELHPNNLKALMALAVSLTNTGQQPEACEALHRWIRYNPRYRHLLQDRSPLDGSPLPRRRGSSISPISTLGCSQLVEVLELYQEAMQQNTEGVDPDLQTGLGVLFNLSSEFDKAVDAFNAALSVRPEDYLLWNRLGATLANGDRSEEAVEAYTRALELQPGFIRSRYNLGISCINLGAHREAVSNFLTALHQQRKSRSHQVMSSNIWAALRIALSLMNQPELFQAATVGDLDLLMRAFNMDM